MTNEEKINLLNDYDNIEIFTDEHFELLQSFSVYEDAFVRSMSAACLINFDTPVSKNILVALTKDDNALVRTEAFDSLSAFPYDDVEEILKNAISSEIDDLARSYAIHSWIDIVLASSHITEDKISFLQKQKEHERAANCLLSYCYGLYLLGNREECLEDILSFLKHEDYHIRCAVLSLLDGLADEFNREAIRAAVAKLLQVEDSFAAKDKAIRLLDEL